MSIIAPVVGLLIIAATVWQITKRGIPDGDGSVDGVNSHDFTQGGGGFPPA